MTENISSAIGSTYLSMLQNPVSNSMDSSAEETETSANGATEASSESKFTQEILTELNMSGSSYSITAQDIADEYGISLVKAQEILQELHGEDESLGYVKDNPTPEGSTVSYHV